MTLRTLSLADAVYVAERMRAQDRECLHACTNFTSDEAFAVNRWQTEGAAWTLLRDREPVAIGGVSFPVPWTGVFWLIATDAMRMAEWKKLVRHAHTVLRNASTQVPRLEAHVLATWPEAVSLAEHLGFQLEGVRRRAGRDGQDVLTFVHQGKS